jgi:hypothetical protein
MAGAIKQVSTTGSSAASPSNLTVNLGSPSQAGNSLLLAVAVTGATPSITPLAGWTVVQNNVAPAGLAVGLFLLPGVLNTGINGVIVTVGGTGGGAVAALFEMNGAAPVTQDATATQNGTGTSYGNLALAATSQFNELLFYVVGFAAATLTPSNSADWSAVQGAVVSTNGTPNAQIACFFQNTPRGVTPTIGGSLSASVVNQENIARFSIPGSDIAVNGPGGSVFVGNVGTPAGALQVPQPQGIGNFFSGSIGVG